MSRLHYRTTVYRGAYAALFVGGYLLLAAYILSGDDSGSESSAGIWRLVLGLAVAALTGAVAGPRLHRRLFKYPARHRATAKPIDRSHHPHSR